jgi:2-keto-4-pentenoate hydratase/2-oxohepta-3-ene-1,7-dioic acid hydratase in catechol pathway
MRGALDEYHKFFPIPEVAMRLATIHTWAGPRAAVQHGDSFIDVHATDPDVPPSVRQILDGGPELLRAVEQVAERADAIAYETAKVKFLAPVYDPQKIVCIGLNYRDHAAESGSPIPKEPILFSKYPTALIGHGESIVLPAVSREVDY